MRWLVSSAALRSFSMRTASHPSTGSRARSTVGVPRLIVRTVASLTVAVATTRPSTRWRTLRSEVSTSTAPLARTTTTDWPYWAAVDSKPVSRSEK